VRILYGGSVGLMGAVADAALKKGGQVFGVIPKALVNREIEHKSLTKLYVVENMHQRKQMMFDLSDAFIALPGGLGTFEEICEVLTWGQLGMHKKPCGFLNVDGFYNSLIQQFDHAVAEKLLKPEHRALALSDTKIDGLWIQMQTYHAPDSEKWIGRKET
jgi:uncharacterized protein (TIGR00730 family)